MRTYFGLGVLIVSTMILAIALVHEREEREKERRREERMTP